MIWRQRHIHNTRHGKDILIVENMAKTTKTAFTMISDFKFICKITVKTSFVCQCKNDHHDDDDDDDDEVTVSILIFSW